MLKNTKTALVTGGATRVGLIIVEYLLSRGYNIALHYNTSKDNAIKIKDKYPNRITLFNCDFSYIEQIVPFIDSVIATIGNIDLLVNSAAVFNKIPLTETSVDQLVDEFKINFFAPYLLSSRYIKTQKEGLIINIADAKTNNNIPKMSAYLLSKKTLVEFTKLAALETGTKIRINTISPGYLLKPTNLDNYTTEIPVSKKVTIQDFHKALEYIIDSPSVHGQNIVIDGGLYI